MVSPRPRADSRISATVISVRPSTRGCSRRIRRIRSPHRRLRDPALGRTKCVAVASNPRSRVVRTRTGPRAGAKVVDADSPSTPGRRSVPGRSISRGSCPQFDPRSSRCSPTPRPRVDHPRFRRFDADPGCGLVSGSFAARDGALGEGSRPSARGRRAPGVRSVRRRLLSPLAPSGFSRLQPPSPESYDSSLLGRVPSRRDILAESANKLHTEI